MYRRTARVAKFTRAIRFGAIALAACVIAATAAAIPATAAPAVKSGAAPLLPTDPGAAPKPQVPAGDFSYIPGQSGLTVAKTKQSAASFDAARSVTLDEQTTETRRVWKNADGTFTTRVDADPVRYKEASGRWVDYDTTLGVGADGKVRAKAAPTAAVLSQQLDAVVATLDTAAGPITFRRRGLLAAPPTLSGATARFGSAVAGTRDVAVAATRDGFEETATLADRRPGPTYQEEFVVPDGVAVRSVDGELEFVDAGGAVVGRYGVGAAHDASWPQAGPAAAAPVTLRVLDRTAAAPGFSAVTIEVAVDEAWFTSPSRAFPVTIDPTWYRQTSQTGASDAWVSSGANANTSYWNNPWLVAGSADGVQMQRSYMRFDLSGVPSGPDVWVSDATLWLTNWYSPSCTQQSMNLYRLLGPFSASTTWNNPPSPAATTPATSGPVAAAGATGCPTNWVTLPATPIAQDWLRSGAANYGLELRAASETNPANYRAYYSAEAAGSANAPTLYITWNHQPPTTTPVEPAAGAVVPTPSPKLVASKVTDPDNDTVKYFFRVTTGPDAESGFIADNSGWITPAGLTTDQPPPPCPIDGNACGYVVPAGVLHDGLTYGWHEYAVRHEAP